MTFSRGFWSLLVLYTVLQLKISQIYSGISNRHISVPDHSLSLEEIHDGGDLSNRNFKDSQLIYPWWSPPRPKPEKGHVANEKIWQIAQNSVFVFFCDTNYRLDLTEYHAQISAEVNDGVDYESQNILGESYNDQDQSKEDKRPTCPKCEDILNNPNVPRPSSYCCYELDQFGIKLKIKCFGENITDVPRNTEICVNDTVNIYHFEMEHTKLSELVTFNFITSAINIEIIHLNNNRLHFIDPEAFASVIGVRTLKMSGNELNYILPQNFRHLNDLQSLELKHDMIALDQFDSCDEKTVEDIEPVLPSLVKLDMEGNPLKEIPKLYFAALRNSTRLRTLILNSCQLQYIHPNNMKFLKYLEYLELKQNPKLMPTLHISMLELKSNMEADGGLTDFYLSFNDLPQVPTRVLEPFAQTLEKLKLDSNAIEVIENGHFPSDMSALTHLNLENNRIKYIGNDAFNGMSSLTELYLHDNRLKMVPFTISHLPKLKVAYFSNNPSAEDVEQGARFQIPNGIFINNSEIHNLNFELCPIEVLGLQTFNGLVKLKTLNMISCCLRRIEDFTFHHTKSLEDLYLDNNPLKSINEYTFFGLANLKYLDMKNCSLTDPLSRTDDLIADDDDEPILENPLLDFVTIGQMVNKLSHPNEPILDLNGTGSVHKPFRYTFRLESVDLKGNEYRTLDSRMFRGIQYLRVLDLSDNKIGGWDDEPVFLNTSFSKINLANNRIMTLTRAMIEEFDSLSILEGVELDISDNPLICDIYVCKLKQLVNARGNTWLSRWNDLPSKHMCYYTRNRTSISMAIQSLTDEDCKYFEDLLTTSDPLQPTITTLAQTDYIDDPGGKSFIPKPIVSLIISVTVLSILFGISFYAYKKRLHLRYMLNFKFRVSKAFGEEKLISDKDADGRKEYDYDIFISYSHSDYNFIQDQLVPEIEGRYDLAGRSLRICLHERDFEVGVPITENIIDCVDRSKKVLAVISRRYLDSQWCLFEMNLIYHRLIERRRKAFLVILLEEIPQIKRTKILNYLMGSRTYLLWPSSSTGIEQASFWTRLRNSLL